MLGIEKRRTSLVGYFARRVLPILVFTTIGIDQAAHAEDLMNRIARCESGGNQYDAQGKVLRNKSNPAVVGVFQINERYHAATARRLGYNIYTREGNWAYARWLLKSEGTTPWTDSEHCWRVAAK